MVCKTYQDGVVVKGFVLADFNFSVSAGNGELILMDKGKYPILAEEDGVVYVERASVNRIYLDGSTTANTIRLTSPIEGDNDRVLLYIKRTETDSMKMIGSATMDKKRSIKDIRHLKSYYGKDGTVTSELFLFYRGDKLRIPRGNSYHYLTTEEVFGE